jgi:hypothetical protein
MYFAREGQNAYMVLVGKSEIEKPLERDANLNLCSSENTARLSGWWSVSYVHKQVYFVRRIFFVKNKYLLDILLHV